MMQITRETRGKALIIMTLIACLGTLALQSVAAESDREGNFRAAQDSYVITGMRVLNYLDEYLGRVEDTAMDVENGRFVEVIVASGGFLGFNQRIVAVPPGALWYDPVAEVLRLGVSVEKFKLAPKISLSQWGYYSESRFVAQSYRYFGRIPYFAADGDPSPSGQSATEPLGYIQRSSKLRGMPVRNLQNEALGTVKSFLFSLRSGRLQHVVVRAPGFAGTRSVVPATALRFNSVHTKLSFDASVEAFKKEPRFKWAPGGQGDFSQEAYVNREVAANDGVNTRQNVNEGRSYAYTPLAQGLSFADVDKTYRIHLAMQADASLSRNARNVEIGTLNGRITLRGHVNTPAGKRDIGKIAAGVGRAENVSNLLEIRFVPGTFNQTN